MAIGFLIGFLAGRRRDKKKAEAQRAATATRTAAAPALNAPEVDPFRGDEVTRSAIASAGQGDWAPIEALLRDRQDRGWIMACIEDSPVSTEALTQWVHQDPTSTRLAVLGGRHVVDAWNIRGSGSASSVDKDAWAPFHEKLREAEATLQQAAAADPNNAGPYLRMVTTAMALSMGKDAVRSRFEEGHKREPFHPGLCSRTLQGLCAKWSGSHEEMFQFARWIEQTAPVNSAARAALPQAHIEMAQSSDLKMRAYLIQPTVNAELCDAADSWLAAVPGHTPEQLGVLNNYAATIYPIDARSARTVLAIFDALGDRVTESPWVRFGRGKPGAIMALRRQKNLEDARSLLS